MPYAPKDSASAKKPDPDSWRNSKARSLLESMLRTDQIPASMKPKQVYELRQEFKDFDPEYKNWGSRLSSLRSQVNKERFRFHEDSLAFENFRKLNPLPTHDSQGKLLWDRSAAKEFLRSDLKEGKHEIMKPQELWNSRLEYYENFTLEVFRNHLYQEKRTEKWYRTQEAARKAKAERKGKPKPRRNSKSLVVLPV